ncbi:MAG TPA: DUF5715 family protein [Streptosporangiaceae bacterium]|nr:DUF5715 family protein [Streptosporangiaceae bacterium]
MTTPRSSQHVGSRPRATYAPVTASAVRPADVAAYRAAVADLHAELVGQVDPRGVREAEKILTERLGTAEFTAVFSATPNGVPDVTHRLLLEVRSAREGTRSSGVDLTTWTRIYLLAQIDAMWWGQMPALVKDSDVLTSAELVDLEALRRRGLLRFQYRCQAATLPSRAARAAERRVRPYRAPRTAGLRFARARPEAVALVNQMSARFATACPPDAPQLWVTSLARSIEHQHRLRALGYAATMPSSHCVGYAIDIEMSWFRRFGAHQALTAVLLERQAEGTVNVIDEGQTWHVCISPGAAAGLRDAFAAQVAG